MTLAIFLIVLFGGIALGLPIAFVLLLSAAAMMVQLGIFSDQIFAQTLINGIDSFPLLAIPFFMVAGEVMSAGGLSKRIVRMAMAFFGHMQGGLGYVVIFTSILLAGLSGSAVADAAALSSMLLPMLRGAGYPDGRSVGLLASGGIIAPVIPPSLPLILIGVAGNISIMKLFLGGIAPGLMMGAMLIIIWRMQTRKESLPTQPKATGRERMIAVRDGFWALLLPIIIIVGIRTGTFTPTEAAVVAAVYAIIISVFVYREMNLRKFYEVMLLSGRSTAMVMFLVGAALVASWVMTYAQLPQQIAILFEPLIENPKLLMAAIMLLVFVVGMVMDLGPSVLILTPLFMPLVKEAGIDPVYFGLMFVINASIGLITPPVGNVLNVVCGVGRVPYTKGVQGSLPYVAGYIILLILFIIFPNLIITPMEWLTK